MRNISLFILYYYYNYKGLMDKKNIYNIEKDLFSLVHSEFDKMLYNINNNKNKITNKELSMFMELNKEILNIRNLMENINNTLLKKKKPNLTIKDIEKMESYDKDNKSIKAFLPYLIYFRMMLDQ